MSRDVNHFLIVFRRSQGASQVQEFGTDNEAAAEMFERLEEEYLDSDDVEVVLLESESLETLKRTHSSYFSTSDAVGSLMRTYSAASSS